MEQLSCDTSVKYGKPDKVRHCSGAICEEGMVEKVVKPPVFFLNVPGPPTWLRR